MSDTKESLQQGEDFQTKWEANKDAARDSLIDEISSILMPIEHLVDDVDLHVDVKNVLTVAEAINKVVNLRFFEFKTDVEGKYQVFEETFDYDFTDEVRDFLNDQIGFKMGEGVWTDIQIWLEW